MKVKDFLQIGGNGLQYLISIAQVEDILRLIGIILSVMISVLIIADKLVTWWKKSKADGKLTEDEAKEGIKIIKDGVVEIKDHIDKDKKQFMGNTSIPARYAWFSNIDKYLLKDKNELIALHFNYALLKTLEMFEYEGLPDTIPQRELERIIQTFGFAYLLKANDGKFYAFYGGLGGKPNPYYQPSEFIVANPALKFYDQVEINEDGVLVWNDYAHMGLTPMIRRYAELMAECDITLRFGLINARIVSVIEALNDTMKDSAKSFFEKVEKGEEIGICVGKGFETDDGTSLKVNDYRKANSQDLKSVMELQQYLKASYLNEIGLQANYNMKREAINDSEASMNEEALKPICDNMLKSRQEAFDLFNKKYGLNIKVKFGSSWIMRNKIGEADVSNEEQTNKEETPEEKTEEVEQ